MPTTNVNRSAELVEFVKSDVASGERATASEIGREEKIAALRREVSIGVEQARAGRFSQRSVLDIVAGLG